MKNTIKHRIGKASRAFAVLLLIFSFGFKESIAQREIYPWEPEFDSSYAIFRILNRDVINNYFSDIRYYNNIFIHYNQFFSKWNQKHSVKCIEISFTSDDNSYRIIELHKYNKSGFLLSTVFVKIDKIGFDTIGLTKYTYQNNGKSVKIRNLKKNSDVSDSIFLFFDNNQEVIKQIFWHSGKSVSIEQIGKNGLHYRLKNDLNNLVYGEIIQVEEKCINSQEAKPCLINVLNSAIIPYYDSIVNSIWSKYEKYDSVKLNSSYTIHNFEKKRTKYIYIYRNRNSLLSLEFPKDINSDSCIENIIKIKSITTEKGIEMQILESEFSTSNSNTQYEFAKNNFNFNKYSIRTNYYTDVTRYFWERLESKTKSNSTRIKYGDDFEIYSQLHRVIFKYKFYYYK